MLFFEGKEILILKPFVSKVKVLFEEKEFFIVEINGKKEKIEKKGLLFCVENNKKIFFFKGNYLIHDPIHRPKRFRKKIIQLKI